MIGIMKTLNRIQCSLMLFFGAGSLVCGVLRAWDAGTYFAVMTFAYSYGIIEKAKLRRYR